MTKSCYVCDKEVHIWRQNICKLKLPHSKRTIGDLLKQFLGDIQPTRNVDNESNCICVECFDRMNKYDWLWTTALKKEEELRHLYLNTEKSHMDDADEVSVLKDDFEDEVKHNVNDEADVEFHEIISIESGSDGIGKKGNCDFAEPMDQNNADTSTEEQLNIEIDEQPLIKSESELQIETDGELDMNTDFLFDFEEELSDGNIDEDNSDERGGADKSDKRGKECEICKDGINYNLREMRVSDFPLHPSNA